MSHFGTNCNFIREHGSIKKTLAEQAGIKLNLGSNKIEGLIRLASMRQKDSECLSNTNRK